MAAPKFQEKVYEIRGHKISTRQAGKSGRQVALMIHGWSSSWYAMSPLLGMMAQRFHCIAVDLPGYGDSPKLAGKTTIPRYVEVLADLISEVSNGPVVLVGHSMGGMISLTLAITYPILVERMILLNPTISGRLSTFINLFITPITMMERFGLGSFIVSAVERSVSGITERLIRPVSFAARTDIANTDYERLRYDIRRPDQGKVRAECFEAMRENDLSGELSQIDTPSLILWGAEDNTVPLRDAGIVADEWPQADLRIIPKAGHWPHFETPEITKRQVAAYLGLPSSSSELFTPVEDEDFARINEVAHFLAHSDIGNNLNLAQRTRLAAQCQVHHFEPGADIVHATEFGQDLYVIMEGTVEVWKDPDGDEPGEYEDERVRYITTFRPGQMTGELAMLDQGERSADLISGPDGATVLTFNRDRLQTLTEDDAVLGSRLMWNISTTMARRVRFILWQLNRAQAQNEAVPA